MLGLSYLGPLALIPLMAETDGEVRWHARHGLLLLAATLLTAVLLGILCTVPGLGCLYLFGVLLLPTAWLAISALCFLAARRGDRFLVPGLSGLVDQLPDPSRKAWIAAVALIAVVLLLWLLLFDGLALIASPL